MSASRLQVLGARLRARRKRKPERPRSPATGRPYRGKDPSAIHGTIYFIQCESEGRPIKIGFARNFEKRFRQLSLMVPFPLRVLSTWPGTLATEQKIHRWVARWRLHGEWYRGPELLGFIAWLGRQAA